MFTIAGGILIAAFILFALPLLAFYGFLWIASSIFGRWKQPSANHR